MENAIEKMKTIQKNSTRNVLIDFINASVLAKEKFSNPGDVSEFDEIMKNYKLEDVLNFANYFKTVIDSTDEKSKLIFLNQLINSKREIREKTKWFITGKFS